MGPVAGERRVQAMERLTADALRRGARLLHGGERLGGRGSFFAPTVLADVRQDADVFREEPFGPIVPVAPYTTWDEVVERANAVRYALAAYVFTGSHATALAATRD